MNEDIVVASEPWILYALGQEKFDNLPGPVQPRDAFGIKIQDAAEICKSLAHLRGRHEAMRTNPLATNDSHPD